MPLAYPVYNNDESVVAGHLPVYTNASGELIQSLGKGPSQFIQPALTSTQALTGDLNLTQKALLAPQIDLSYSVITSTSASTIYPVDVLSDVVIVDTSLFSAQITLGVPAYTKSIVIRMKYQWGQRIVCTTAGSIILIDANQPLATLAYDGSEWWVASTSHTLGSYGPNMFAWDRLIPDGYVSGGQILGLQVSMSSDGYTLAAGATGDDVGGVDIGACYVWEYDTGGEVWFQAAQLIPTGYTGTPGMGQATSLSSDGNRLACSGLANASGQGAVWIFRRPGIGFSWVQEAMITASGFTGSGIGFGYRLAFSADGARLFVCAAFENSNKGALYIFSRTGTSWTQIQRIVPVGTDAGGSCSEVVCSATGLIVVVGCDLDTTNTGCFIVLTSTDRITWTQVGGIYRPVGVSPNAYIGQFMALSADGMTLAVTNNIDAVSTTGQVNLYSIANGVPTEQCALVGINSIGAMQGNSPVSLSADGSFLIIEGFADDSHNGAIWLFVKRGANWVPFDTKILTPGGSTGTNFGYSCCMNSNGSRLAILALTDDTNIGCVYAFR